METHGATLADANPGANRELLDRAEKIREARAKSKADTSTSDTTKPMTAAQRTKKINDDLDKRLAHSYSQFVHNFRDKYADILYKKSL